MWTGLPVAPRGSKSTILMVGRARALVAAGSVQEGDGVPPSWPDAAASPGLTPRKGRLDGSAHAQPTSTGCEVERCGAGSFGCAEAGWASL